MQNKISRRNALRAFGGLAGSLILAESSFAQDRKKRFSRDEIIPSAEEFGMGVLSENENNETTLKQKIRLIYQNPEEALRNLNNDECEIYNKLKERYYPKRKSRGYFNPGGLGSLGESLGKDVTFQYDIKKDCEKIYLEFRIGMGNVIQPSQSEIKKHNLHWSVVFPLNPSTADLITLTICKEFAPYYDSNKLKLKEKYFEKSRNPRLNPDLPSPPE